MFNLTSVSDKSIKDFFALIARLIGLLVDCSSPLTAILLNVSTRRNMPGESRLFTILHRSRHNSPQEKPAADKGAYYKGKKPWQTRKKDRQKSTKQYRDLCTKPWGKSQGVYFIDPELKKFLSQAKVCSRCGACSTG